MIMIPSAIASLLPSHPRRMRLIKSGPLTNREIEKLDAFLLSGGGLENAMDVFTFEGSSARCSQGRKSSCPRNGCGGSGTRSEASSLRSLRAEKQAQRILSLLVRHADDIAVRGLPVLARAGALASM